MFTVTLPLPAAELLQNRNCTSYFGSQLTSACPAGQRPVGRESSILRAAYAVGRSIAQTAVEWSGTSTTAERGFTLVDLLAVMSRSSASSRRSGIPSMLAARDRIRLGQAAREVEREIQTAKARAVGQVASDARALQLPVGRRVSRRRIDRHGDGAGGRRYGRRSVQQRRCIHIRPPISIRTRGPNLDGPIRTLDSSVTFTVVADDRVPSRRHRAIATRAAAPFRLIPTAGHQHPRRPQRRDAHHHGERPWQSAAAVAGAHARPASRCRRRWWRRCCSRRAS